MGMGRAEDHETLIGRTADGDTVVKVGESAGLHLTPTGVIALIQGLATSQGLIVTIERPAVIEDQKVVPIRRRR